MDGEFDPARRFVRIMKESDTGMVEFAFAIGEPDISVELILPRPAFDEFCQAQQPEFLPPRTGAATAPASDWDWRLSDARRDHFRPR